MPRFDVWLEHRAERELWRLPLPVRRAFHDAFRQLEEDPFRPRPGMDIRRLAGTDGLRLRVGSYRALFQVDVGRRVVIVTRIAHRKNAY